MLSLHQNSITRSSILNLLVPWTWPFTWASFFNETSSIVVNFGKTWFIFLFTVNIQHDVLDLSFLLLILYSSECEFWYMITCSTLVSLLETSSLLRNILFFIMHRRCTWVITSFSYLSSGRRACSNLLLYHKMYASLIVSHIWARETSSFIRNLLLLYIIDVTLVLIHHRCNQFALLLSSSV